MITYKFFNEALREIALGKPIAEIEADYETGFIHKLVKYIRTDDGIIPEKITEAEFLIAFGKLKAEEIQYRKRQADFKKNQTKLDKFFGGD
jgi:hypothetical protein